MRLNSMKYISLALFSALMLLTSCHDFLDIKPFGKTIPKTTEEYQALINNYLAGIDGQDAGSGEARYLFFGNDDVEYFELYADNYEKALIEQPLGSGLRRYIGSYIQGQNAYDDYYAIISRCNMVFDNYTDGKDTQDGQDLIGTSYALRGLAYYQLLRQYCKPALADDNDLGVPIVTTFDMEAKPIRSSYEATVAQIESDFEAAIKCNIQNESMLFNNDILKGLLARLYFWTGQWQKAQTMAEDVLSRHPVLSGDAYKKMMTAEDGLAGNMLIRCDRVPRNTYTFDNLNRTLVAAPLTAEFVDLFKEKDKDIRYSLFFTRKRKNNKIFFSGLRSAELALIDMECSYHLKNETEALQKLNEFRAKRIEDVTPYTMSTLPAVNTKQLIKTDATGLPLTPLIQAILNERRKELYLEGDRFFELKRNGRPEFWSLNNSMKYTTYKYMYTFPIAPKDIQVNSGIIQNPGYTELIY